MFIRTSPINGPVDREDYEAGSNEGRLCGYVQRSNAIVKRSSRCLKINRLTDYADSESNYASTKKASISYSDMVMANFD